ncbi:MAG: urease accessory protein UreE [Leptolyngbya sp. SIO4C5]|uniref:urease accessory protein UreE n=1 Tax=Sphaerothrix gracilis TaxID=3151835 RepID=UPI0013BF8D18|nr:urease accessory protein UreE [Leptolyngbya sp. SIO4C5]
MVIVLKCRLSDAVSRPPDFSLSLTAEERSRSRRHFTADNGEPVYLNLPRGTQLRGGDLLHDGAMQPLVQVVAKPEPLLTVMAATPLDLLRAAYHLGNRHVPLEITPTYLRLAEDLVLAEMLQRLGLQVMNETAPFEPEAGAYQSGSHDA